MDQRDRFNYAPELEPKKALKAQKKDNNESMKTWYVVDCIESELIVEVLLRYWSVLYF